VTNFAMIESLFSDLLNASEGDFSAAECAEVQSFLNVGEYGLALETAVDIYAEEQKIPSPDAISLIGRLITAMSMNQDLVQRCLRK
jgi:hypothetical protein